MLQEYNMKQKKVLIITINSIIELHIYFFYSEISIFNLKLTIDIDLKNYKIFSMSLN